MAKGDHDRGERRIDEQMKQSQSYLAQLQQQMANQYGGFNNMFWGGGGAPQQGNVYGWGTTVPHYSPYGPIFSGNNTDIPVAGSGQTEGAREAGVPRRAFGGSSNTQIPQGGGNRLSGDSIESQLMPYLRSLGAASPQALERGMSGIQQMFPGTYLEDSDEIIIPGFGRVDVGTAFEGGDPSRMNWGFMHNPQFDADMGNGQFGSGGGSSVGGGFGGGGSRGGIFGRNLNDYGGIMGRFTNFADTGGLSEGDKANIRSRAISPIRSIYSSARQGLDRQRSLQGGYAPGHATALGRFSREQGQLTSDATTNAEAAIAEMVQRGKLAGMQGMLGAYGATPGLSNMVGNQMLTSMGQQLQGAGLQNQLSLGLIGGQQNLASVPGDVGGFFNGLGNFSRNMSGAIYPWLMGGGGGGGNSLGVSGDYRVNNPFI